MFEDFTQSFDASHPLPPESLRTFYLSFMNEGLTTGIFDAGLTNETNCQFLNGFELTFSPSERRELPDNATAAQRRDFIADEENRLPTNIASMWDRNNRVLAIGDQHASIDIKQFTTDNMHAFRAAGATAIGLELFQTRDQPVLDRYREIRLDPSRANELPEARQAIESLLRQSQESRYHKTTAEQYLGATPSINATMDIIDAAIENGIRPMAIEPPIPHAFGDGDGYELIESGMQSLTPEARTNFDIFTNPNATEQQRAAARAQLEGYLNGYERRDEFLDTLGAARDARFDFSRLRLNDTSGEGVRDFVNALHDFRNRYWADSIDRYLQESPNARIVMFAGSQHFNYNQRGSLGISSANEQLRERGFGTTVLQFAGGDYGRSDIYDAEMRSLTQFRARWAGGTRAENGEIVNAPPPPDAAMSAALRYTHPARDAGVAARQFALRLQQTREREADYVIHLKQRR